jgi:hypothetical protein
MFEMRTVLRQVVTRACVRSGLGRRITVDALGRARVVREADVAKR